MMVVGREVLVQLRWHARRVDASESVVSSSLFALICSARCFPLYSFTPLSNTQLSSADI